MDGGSTWSVLTDNLSNIDVYALTIDPSDSNTYYWGSVGGTIFKSTNGGSTWSLLADIQGGGRVNKILVDPTNTSKMYASLQGNGLFKSTDGGVTWNSIYFVSTNTGYDLEFKPNNPNTIYASGNGIAVNPNDVNDVHIAGINTWRSTDAGLSFNITSQWVPNNASNLGIGYCHADVDILHFAGSGSEAKLYVGTDGGIFKTDDPITVSTKIILQ